MAKIIFITGTDTDVGKTVLSALLTSHLHRRGIKVAALKPICSGGRDDAKRLCEAMASGLGLDEVNPWHFRAALAPVLAARQEGRGVKLEEVVRHVRAVASRFEVVIVEGAGGLLSPLGEGFDSRDLIQALRAKPIIVCPNRLGAVNQARLVWEALPASAARHARLLLVQPKLAVKAGRLNPALLAEYIDASRIHQLPWLRLPTPSQRPFPGSKLARLMDELLVD